MEALGDLTLPTSEFGRGREEFITRLAVKADIGGTSRVRRPTTVEPGTCVNDTCGTV